MKASAQQSKAGVGRQKAETRIARALIDVSVSRWRLTARSLLLPFVFCLLPLTATAQTRDGKLLVTVTDQTGAIIANATVTVIGTEPATKAMTIAPAKTSDRGVATFDNLLPGKYSIQAEFPEFDLGLLRDTRLKSGENKHVVVLPLKKVADEVTVGQNKQVAASTRQTFGSALTREQIEALSDDPDEMQRQLLDLAGPNAKIRVDSFEGAQLPNKAQIKSIHITRDQYAAESHYIGETFVEIITAPGMGPFSANANLSYHDGNMSSRNAFTPVKGPEANRRFGVSSRGTIAKQRASFSVNFGGTNDYTTPILHAQTPTGPQSGNIDVRQPRVGYNSGGYLDYALTKDQTFRASFTQSFYRGSSLGIGSYDLPERAYATESKSYSVMLQEAGPIGRRLFINTRAYIRWSDFNNKSLVEAQTIRVTDAFTSGGQQRSGGSHTRSITANSDLDYVRGINSWRTGLMLEGYGYRNDDRSNYLGTYTFTSLDAYNAGTPAFYTKQIGDPIIEYWNLQFGAYVQDDIRVSKSFTISPGIRYEAQNHVDDYNSFGPRLGFTWTPFKNGKTTIRAGGGMFYNWLSSGTWAQTIRFDGTHQRELNIANPAWPDPGSVGTITPANLYTIGDNYKVPRSIGYSLGLDQVITPRFRVYLSYRHNTTSDLARGMNLNLPVNGVRPDPAYVNVIQTVSDAGSRDHSFNASFNLSLASPSAATSRARFNWRRMSLNGFVADGWSETNTEGAFAPPPNGTIDTEWGPTYVAKYASVSISSSQLRNLSANVSMNFTAGNPYNITTGTDTNGDLVLNDRPAGVARNTGRNPSTHNFSVRTLVRVRQVEGGAAWRHVVSGRARHDREWRRRGDDVGRRWPSAAGRNRAAAVPHEHQLAVSRTSPTA